MKVYTTPIKKIPISDDLDICIYDFYSYDNPFGIWFSIYDAPNYIIAGLSNSNTCRKYKIYTNSIGDYFIINKKRYYISKYE